MLPFAHVKIRTTVRTTRHLSDWLRSKHLLTPVCRVSMGGDRPWRPWTLAVGCAQARALGRPGHDHRATGHTSQTPSTSRGVQSSHACAGRHHTMEPAPAIHSARTLLTQNLRAKSARSRTEYKREKSAPCEQNKSGGEHV